MLSSLPVPLYVLKGPEDVEHDAEVGFKLISTDDIDEYGSAEIIKLIRARIGDSPVYLRYANFFGCSLNSSVNEYSFDIDVIGTP